MCLLRAVQTGQNYRRNKQTPLRFCGGWRNVEDQRPRRSRSGEYVDEDEDDDDLGRY